MRATFSRPRSSLDVRAAEEPRTSRRARGAEGGMPLFLGSAAPMRFPHAASIESAVGGAIPGAAVHDPEGCARRGVRAFTDGAVTHFAAASPELHVSAHEAAHQLQHGGHTNDAGMGPEAHAHAVADAVASGTSARGYLGAGGRPVAPALRHYTEMTSAQQTAAGQWIIGTDARVADSGLMVTSKTDGHVCWAEASLIEAANLILRAKQSAVRLRAGAAGPSGSAPDGSGVKTTVEVIAQVRTAGSGGETWADCGRMSRDVQGVEGTDNPARGFYTDGSGTQRETSAGATTDIRDEALIGSGLGTDGASARAAHAGMTDPAIRDAFDAAHGINRHAAPNVGESFMSVRDDSRTLDGFNFHWGGVIMVSGGDRVTFENFARPGTNYGTQNMRWYFDMYGPPSRAGQTWHDRWAEGSGREGTGVGLPGHGSITVPTRTSADPSPWTPGTPAMTTGDLITRRAAAATEGERMAYDAELRTRSVKVDVTVVKAQENPDDVYVRIEHGGRSRSTGRLSMRTGDRNIFFLPLSAIEPITGDVHVHVYDYDYLSADDMISNIILRTGPVTATLPWDDAEYRSAASFDPR
jgi:hypothetical protein